MLFDIPFIADWCKIGEHRQSLADHDNMHENKRRIDYDYKIGDRVLIAKNGILRKSESKFGKEPWNNDGSYKWNYQGSMWNTIGTYKYPESNSLHRGIASAYMK